MSRRCVRVGKEERNERREEPIRGGEDHRRFDGEGGKLENIEVGRKMYTRRALAGTDVSAEP